MESTLINCKGSLLDLENPIVMGILNLTPDSFFDGGKHEKTYLNHVEKMIQDGAKIIDIGAMSSRPGSDFISEEIELQRLIGPIQEIVKNFPDTILSIDTFRSKVAEEAIISGGAIINDISGGNLDPSIFQIATKYKTPYVLMHMRGIPKVMQEDIHYDEITKEVIQFFITQIDKLRTMGVMDIIIDPGFGFGKDTIHNFTLLKELSHFKLLACPILVGISRKSIVNKVIHTKAAEALNGTTALHMLALQNGAKILRAHDVKEAHECVQLFNQYNLV